MENLKEMHVFEPAYHYNDDGKEHGLLSNFDPTIKTLPEGFQLDAKFRPLPVDIVFEKDVAVTIRYSVTIV